MIKKDFLFDLETIGIDYCNLFISFLMSKMNNLDQETVDKIKTVVFHDVMAQICSSIDMSENDGNIRDFYDKVNDIPDFKVLGYYDFLLEHDTNIFFCDITKHLAHRVYSLVNNYIDLSSLTIRTSLCSVTLNTLIITVEKTGQDTFTDIIF